MDSESQKLLAAIKEPFWAMNVEEVLAALASAKNGLSEKEAGKRLKIFGPNEIKDRREWKKLKIAIRQFKSPLIALLVIAGIITIFLKEWTETIFIFAAVLINSSLGFWQENKAETVLELLKSYIRGRSRVERAGKEEEIDASELVPGDIVKISQGDRVPVDARIISSNNLEIDESILTGESMSAEKTSETLPAGTALIERKNMLFSGTAAVGGLCSAVITVTGKNTEFGKITELAVKEEEESTPLQKDIAKFAAWSGLILGSLTIGLFVLGIYAGKNVYDMFVVAVAVAISAVPEGLPIALTVILAIGVERLAKKNGVVRKLLAAETLGSTSLILTDKTGTLTEARMQLASAQPYEAGKRVTSDGGLAEKNLLYDALWNTDTLAKSPIEISLVKSAAEKEIILTPEEKSKILDKLPFGSAHKFSATLIKSGHEYKTVILGAPEILLEFTNLPEEEKKKIRLQIDKRAYGGERVLGLISKESASHQDIHNLKFENFKFRGLISFRDPIRQTVKHAISKIKASGVRTVIVTGDHKGTAEAVARELGLVDGKGAVLTGDDLKYLSEEELRSRANEVTVYARVSPEQKVMLVNLYKSMGEIVAVTGDGVNDAPALKAADIGVVVGSGTEVAKSVADLVILDDNFETLVTAIEGGRKILENIKKVIIYLLNNSLDELCLIGGSLLMGIALPINALQILFVNFFLDSFPAIAFAFEDGVDDAGLSPRKSDNALFDPQMRFLILIIGAATSAMLFALYYFLLKINLPEELVRTFIFASFSTYTLFLTFSLRSLEKNIFSYNPFSNRYLAAGVAIGVLLTLSAIYIPILQQVFGTVSLPLIWLLGVLGVGLANIAAVEFSKWLFRKKIL